MTGRRYTEAMVQMLVRLCGRGHCAEACAAMINRAFHTDLDAADVRAKCAARGIPLRAANDVEVMRVSLSPATPARAGSELSTWRGTFSPSSPATA
jgi:hypothetical protein